jgi:hypothetical protein
MPAMKPLLPIGDLLNRTVELFKSCFEVFAYLALFLFLRIGVSYGVAGIVAVSLKLLKVPFWSTVLVVLASAATLYTIYAMILNYAASIAVVAYSIRDRRLAEERARELFVPYLWTSILSIAIIMLGYLCLILPGIIFTIWFWLVPIVLAVEGKQGWEALMASKEIMQGRFWDVTLRLFIAMILATGVTMIPLIGFFLTFFVYPFFIVYGYILYDDLRGTH